MSQSHLQEASSWPFQEARTLLDKRLRGNAPDKGYVLFETGYGPSGLPHIGTFGEVARTSMVRHAFSTLVPEMETRLVCFSDDMDGLRKVPENIPNRDMVSEHLGKPLTQIPDPFEKYESFGHHNNAMLQSFLDSFGFSYEFRSATAGYHSGAFDDALRKVLENYEAILDVILPTLGEERRTTYSPFLPLCPETGRVLQVPVVETFPERGTIVYEEDGRRREVPVTGGNCKLQWKVDWGTRWVAQDVDYEMSGKDLMESVRLSSRICRILGGRPPQNLTYELFLDQNGEKISKSRGNGLSMDEWLRYAPHESLSLFMFKKPRAAKKLYFDVIPRTVDEYMAHLESYETQSLPEQVDNPVWHVHEGAPRVPEKGVSYSLLLNLVNVCHTEDPATVWHYVSRYAPGSSPEASPFLDQLVHHAIAYYRDFVKPAKTYRTPTPEEAAVLQDLAGRLKEMPETASAEEIQSEVYEVGKAADGFSSLKAWFKGLYQILLGQNSGPRMGSFFALYGIEESCRLLEEAAEKAEKSA